LGCVCMGVDDDGGVVDGDWIGLIGHVEFLPAVQVA
jgi:hypothetical protein